MKVGVPEEARFSYLHHAQNAVQKITMTVSDHCLGLTTNTDDPVELCRVLNVRCLVSAEATIAHCGPTIVWF